MQQNRYKLALARLVASIVISYGLIVITTSLLRQLRAHPGHDVDILLLGIPQVVGMGFVYLGTLLLRRKHNAWIAALMLFGFSLILSTVRLVLGRDFDNLARAVNLTLPLLIVALLILTHDVFQVRSDIRTFRRALWVSLLVLSVAFAYGVSGFLLLDRHDFQHNMTVVGAMHETVDQFSLTTDHPVAHTRRARVFMDSLPIISIASVCYVAISLFDPIRMRFVNQYPQRELAKQLLNEYPSDIDDYFKLWPHDKLYFFNERNDAGIAYHVASGVALVIGDPFGNPKHFPELCRSFQELCFVNDWRLSFIHVGDAHRKLYEKMGFRVQKLGEEGVVDLQNFNDHSNDKYFRQIRNRFAKQEFTVELLEAPHSPELINELKAISDNWLERPGRAERGLTMGYFSNEYMQQCQIVVARDPDGAINGFINLVPTFEPGLANYDMLRCKSDAPGNCNDYILLGAIEILQSRGYTKLNLGLSPLSGLDADAELTSMIDTALRFIYANSGRFFSFEGLRRFKAKYYPDWENRYIVYTGTPANFARIMTALTRAMKVK